MRIRAYVLVLPILLGAAPRTDSSSDRQFLKTTAYVEVKPSTVTCKVITTAYNSEPGQTDATPDLTSVQTPTRWGIVAARWLPIGTRVRIPGHFADEVFVVEDRMPPANWCKMDIWHQNRPDADGWGIRFVNVEVLDVPAGFACPVQPMSVDYKCPQPDSAWDRRAAKPIRIASSK